MTAAPPPVHWTELLRALWPVFVAIGGLAIGGILLGLKTMFASVKGHQQHHDRLCVLEVWHVEQRTALDILPTRQQLSEKIGVLSDRNTETKEELSEQLAEQGERIAGVETGLKGIRDQLNTTNQYLHTLLERGLR